MQYSTPTLVLPRLNCLVTYRTNEALGARWDRYWPGHRANTSQRSFGEIKRYHTI